MEDDPQNGTGDPWLMSRLGYAIDAYVDREINKPTAIANSGAYGVGADGRMYMQGQPAQGAIVQPRQPVNTTLLLLVLAGVYLAMNR